MQHPHSGGRFYLGCAGVEKPGLGPVGRADIKIRGTLDKVDLQRQRVAGRESVAVNFREEVRGRTLNVEQVFALHAHLGHTGQQRPGVGVAGVVVNFVRSADLHDVAGIHDGHTVSDVGHDAEVMGDEDDGEVIFDLHLLQQLEDLGLNGHVQSRCGLIADKDLRVAGYGNGDDDALVAAATLSNRYISGRQLPDKAIDLVDEAAAHLRMELDSSPEEIDELRRQVDRLKMEKSYLLGNPKNDKAAEKAEAELDDSAKDRLADLNQEIADKSEKLNGLKARWDAEKNGHNRIGDLRKKLDELRTQAEKYEREGDLAKSSAINYGEIPAIQKEIAQAEKNEAESGGADNANADVPMVPDRVDADSIAEIVSDWTGIPVGRLMQGENEKLLHMEEYLGKRVIGQKEAIQAVSDAVRRSRAGISDPNRPTGSFLFLGPTGVGKTELAKALADFLFDDEKAMVRIDMSEYMEKASVSRLIGAAPGYIGYEEGGQLTEAVRRRPYSVVLFDEVEKANPEVFDVLLQVLDDGRLTDGQGRTVDFKNTILIMTSNLGSQFLVNPDMDADAKKKAVMDAVHMQFKPEFINRLDELVMFHPLTREELGGIVDIQVAQVSARLTDRRITLDVTDSAREWLANTGYDPAYGARPLRRLVQTEVGDQLARMLLAGEVHDGDTVLVDQTGGDHLELSAWAADQLEDMGEEKTDDSADVPNPAE